MKPGVNGFGLMGTNGCPQLGATPVVPEFALDAITPRGHPHSKI